ncbi:META domain-containing protein [Blastococcus sp. TF02A_35]|uniref:META domain-containing protein n=1 Tax=Blastococcus sp. TF02A-35 TaxID=2559612 RepID=UPI0010736641|nr:META domain-containing protein [Blastococcus sp. TF02A_35]TFV53514.1 META domain-containing protein [Blastococcus sp. TF02A_35]
MARTALLLLVALAVAACGGGGTGAPPAEPPGEGPGDVRGEWVVTELRRDGEVVPLPAGVDGTLAVEDARLLGQAFCNSFFTGYRIEGDRLTVEDLGVTAMACLDDGVTTAESRYLAALSASDVRLARDGDRLVVRGGGVDVHLLPRPPVADADLAGTWQLAALVDRETAASPLQPAAVEFRSDGTFTGSTGCRPVRGTWQVADERLTTTDVVTDGECPADLAEQDGQVLHVLHQGGALRIARDRLALTAPDGTGLQFTTG